MDRVLCAGNIVYDLLVRPFDEIKWGTSVWVDSIETHLGGNGANTAYALARLGVPVTLLGAVGKDDFGDFTLNRLNGAGVDTSHIRRIDLPTATTVGLISSSGARQFLHRPGCSTAGFDGEFLFPEAQRFHLGNPFAIPSIRPRAAEIIEAAAALGMKTSIDTGWDARGEWMDMLEPCIAHTDLLFVNEDESKALTGLEDYNEAATVFRALGAQTVVVKLGAAGCAVFSEDESFNAPGFPVHAIDTTGAGDTFAGAFLAGLSRGLKLKESARLANAVGALSVQKLGAVTGLLNYEETLTWIDFRTS